MGWSDKIQNILLRHVSFELNLVFNLKGKIHESANNLINSTSQYRCVIFLNDCTTNVKRRGIKMFVLRNVTNLYIITSEHYLNLVSVVLK